MMISTHFPMIFGPEQSWVVVALILIVGGVIRDFFNRKNAGRTGIEMAMAHSVVFMAALVLFISYEPDKGRGKDAKRSPVRRLFCISANTLCLLAAWRSQQTPTLMRHQGSASRDGRRPSKI